MKNILYQQQEERNSLLKQAYVERIDAAVKKEYLATGLIKLITGPRRSGKSVLSFQLLKEENFAYLNFDDDLLLKHFDENKVIQTLNEVYPDYRYLFLDEIQNLPNWELWVNKLYRRNKNLIVTGSNARLLSREMATSLTGRYIQITVFPFSFAEVLHFHKVSPVAKTPQKVGVIQGYLNTYVQNGGFPETVLNPSILKNYLSTLFDSVLLKDIMKRFQIRQSQQLYDLSNYLLTNYTNQYSFNQLKTDLNFHSVPTVQKFMGYLSEPYLFLNLTKYSTKVKTQQKSPKKSYIIDNGFIKARSFELSPNYGRLLENVVFIELLRRQYKLELDLFYYKTRNDKEIDFVCRKGHIVEQLIQVCYDISKPKTLKRELDALIEASSELACDKLILITWDKEDVIEKNEYKIQLVPAWKWLSE
ncbi:MAG: ATPase [Bacteroidetes bacterium RIFOXYA12_FULL_35_11]|nr:MAG: ATPase [Bacteroidetes bacterium GWF2_35_48]OFY75393.1 MAG: ATPase [Bacteroidetes bacterium RIFOXYA12_FULL_35_11]OFY93947.1 MAG: ATPase [Bacteroidetes bacterium RIFOXYC12_FULL_35_7]OFY97847.1 MAG: ATPase [Bacteroidetes bacterium RIFOXYB2_FULL_35_7]